jgi:signal transduction histidine kinase
LLRVISALLALHDTSCARLVGSYARAMEQQAARMTPELQLYTEIVNRARVGILLYRWDVPPDPGSLRLLIQNAASRRIGSTINQLGKTIRETSPELLASPVVEHYVECYRSGQPRAWSIDWRFEDGRIVNYEASCYPLGTEYLVVSFEDVTEKRRADRELERHARELERSNRELDDFAYVASHDLKSPLRDIHNLASWIGEDLGTSLADGTRRHLTLLKDRIGRMERLLEDLLEYARAGRAESEPVDVEIASIVRDVVALLNPQGFHVEVRSTRTILRAPRTAVELAVRNLIANAVRHHDRQAGLVIVSLDDDVDGWSRLEVSDDGPGIPKEHHERVFRMFQSLKSSDSSGMGLAVVRKVVEASGGRVELVSEGRGTLIRMLWPPAKNALARDA